MRFLHLHSTFTLGGKEARAVRLMNAWGPAVGHAVVSAMPGAIAARDAIDPAVPVRFPDFPPLAGRPSFARLRAIAAAMRGHDLVLTYNWGAMDAVMAHRLFRRALRLPPLVHHEDGFNQDEANGQKLARILWRRAALPTAEALVVPSATLARIARRSWGQPDARLRQIANGIPVARLATRPDAAAIPGFEPRPGELVVGTMAGLRAVKNLPRLVRAFARLAVPARLVIVGEGPERAAILAEAERVGVADRLHMPGFLPDPARYVGLFDVFALSSDSEQAPISLLEAMTAGLPAVCTDVGDVGRMVSAENRPFIVPAEREDAFAAALAALAAEPALRARIGHANRRCATRRFDEAQMIGMYRALYADAVGRPF